MLRGENVICGTTTTGTGTLTLAATPASIGATDFDVLARGLGFGNSAAVLTSYTLVEYTDATFKQPHQMEKGVGTLTLGSSSGIANATLARTTVQETATSLNSQPATYTVSSPSTITIGTAANTLLFIGAASLEIPAFSPYFDTSGTISNSDTFGMPPLGVINANSGGAVTSTITTGTFFYVSFVWAVPLLAKRATVFVTANNVGTSNAWIRLYDVSSTGGPGKLLYDFGLIGSANASLNSNGAAQTGASGSGYLMTPGDYYLCLAANVAGSPVLRANLDMIVSGRLGTITGNSSPAAPRSWTATGTPSSTPDDPAVLASMTVNQSFPFGFALSNA